MTCQYWTYEYLDGFGSDIEIIPCDDTSPGLQYTSRADAIDGAIASQERLRKHTTDQIVRLRRMLRSERAKK